MDDVGKISVPEAARLMRKSSLFVYVGMQLGELNIGTAMKMPGSTKFNYYVSPSKLAAEMGISVEDLFERVRQLRCRQEDTAS